MKTQSILASITLALAGSAFAAGDKHNHAHEHKPLHGGVVVEVKDMDYELVAKATVIQLYLRDHGKPADVSKASAKVTLLTGTEVLHPVAVVIFSGLISSTLLDTFLTPAMFWLFGRKDAERLMSSSDREAL